MRIGEIKAIARRAHDSTTFRESLFDTMQGDDRDEAVHAAWALTHLPKDDNQYIAAHREALVKMAVTTEDVSMRRISLTLLERLDWNIQDKDNPPECYMDLLDFCFEHMMMAEETYGVRSLCMKLSNKLSLPYPELLGELRQCLMMIEPSELGAGVRHTRNKILNCL